MKRTMIPPKNQIQMTTKDHHTYFSTPRCIHQHDSYNPLSKSYNTKTIPFPMTLHIIFYVPYSIFSRQFGLPKPCVLVVYILVHENIEISKKKKKKNLQQSDTQTFVLLSFFNPWPCTCSSFVLHVSCHSTHKLVVFHLRCWLSLVD